MGRLRGQIVEEACQPQDRVGLGTRTVYLERSYGGFEPVPEEAKRQACEKVNTFHRASLLPQRFTPGPVASVGRGIHRTDWPTLWRSPGRCKEFLTFFLGRDIL